MNQLAPNAQYYEMPDFMPAVAQSVNIPQQPYQPNIGSPETDFKSPFQKKAGEIAKLLRKAVNAITGSAAWALVGTALGSTSIAVASAITGTTLPAIIGAKAGAIVGGIKGIFSGLKWADKAETVANNKQLTKERLVAQRISNITANVDFENEQEALTGRRLNNEGQMINNEILLDELQIRQTVDRELLLSEAKRQKLEIAKLEREQQSSEPNQKEYFAELAMAA
jgi:hypothetical protein